MPDEQRIEEQVLSEIAKQGLFTQIETAENIEVDVKTDLLKAVQGTVDSVVVTGQGIVIQEEIRVEQLEIQTDRISINPLSAIFGNLELDKPVNTTARIVLTETDINQAVNSEFVSQKIPTLDLNVEGNIVKLELLFPLEIKLPSDEKMHIGGQVKIHESSSVQQVSFAAVALHRTDSHPILLESFYCAPDHGQSIAFMIALMQKMQELTHQPYFELEENRLRIVSMDVKPGSLSLEVEIQARQVPSI
ncbi:LmeA family phospholipid-binding protein [Phormidesmis priestleyi]